MKNRIFFCAAALCVLLASLVFSMLDHNNEYQRYHQHLEQPGEDALGPCQSCGGSSQLCTHLPIIRIETGGQKIHGAAIVNDTANEIISFETGDNGEEEIMVSLSTVETANTWHHAEDQPNITATALFRIRGNSSRAFSKHSYRIKLVEPENPAQSVDLPLLGMSKENEWALHGPFLDKTLLRNYMWMNISAEVMGYAPNVRFCELILDGEYQGVYVLMETISEGDGRVALTDYESGDPVCSYIVRIGSKLNPLKTIDNFSLYTWRMETDSLKVDKRVEVLYPTLSHLTPEAKEYICADFNEIERLLYSSAMYDRSETWRDLLDVDSFVDYYILQEFLAVNDAFSESTYFYRDVRGKLHIGPVWDYNNALNNFFRNMPTDQFLLTTRGWYGQLMTDEDFVEQVIRRYRQLRGGVLSDAYLNRYIDETIAWLGSAVDRNYQVWGYAFDANQLSITERRRPDAGSTQTIQDVNPSSFEQAVDWMKDYMTQRAAWFDRNVDTLRQHCSDSKKANHIID